MMMTEVPRIHATPETDVTSRLSQQRSTSRVRAGEWSIASIVMQVMVVLIVLFVPFGFDRPSSWGLDFGHFLLLLLVYSVCLVTGIASSIWARRYWLILVQVAILAVGFATILVMERSDYSEDGRPPSVDVLPESEAP